MGNWGWFQSWIFVSAPPLRLLVFLSFFSFFSFGFPFFPFVFLVSLYHPSISQRYGSAIILSVHWIAFEFRSERFHKINNLGFRRFFFLCLFLYIYILPLLPPCFSAFLSLFFFFCCIDVLILVPSFQKFSSSHKPCSHISPSPLFIISNPENCISINFYRAFRGNFSK